MREQGGSVDENMLYNLERFARSHLGEAVTDEERLDLDYSLKREENAVAGKVREWNRRRR